MKQKRSLLIAVVAIVICAGILWMVVSGILSLFGTSSYSKSDVEQYLSSQWKDYPLRTCQGNTVIVKSYAKITFDQAVKYGAEGYDEPLLNSYVVTAKEISLGLQSECAMENARVVLEQYSTDEQIIFTADSDGNIKTCWEEK